MNVMLCWFSMIVWIWGLCVQTKDGLWS